MCGILGWISPTIKNPENAKKEATPALETLKRRGPDDMRMECGDGWLLGHTRLSVIDLTDRASQPMTDGDGRWLIHNGEIYNFKELRKELISLGFRFRSTGDTEVLLYALREWGPGCMKRLRGMFAFAWLDTKKRELILARDRYGVKPMVYECRENEFRFASDLFALRALPGEKHGIDTDSAYLYLGLGYVPAPYSILKGIKKVKQGHYLRILWSENGIIEKEERPYWSIGQIPPAEKRSSKDSADFLRKYEEKTIEAIRYRLISDVPVGSLFSGGIDSSLVTIFSREQPETEIPSFTMGFKNSLENEAPFASAIAKHIGLKHREFYISEKDLLGEWDNLFGIYDEPLSDTSLLPMVALCRLVRPHVKVAVSGDGGDEVFCGYPWHRAMNLLGRMSMVPFFMKPLLASAVSVFLPVLKYKAAVFSQKDRISQWSMLRTGIPDEKIRLLPFEDAHKKPPFSEYFRSRAKELKNITNPLDWASRMELLTYLPDDLMVKADRASMNVGLELREPLLDHELTAWCLELPLEYRYDQSDGTGKLLSRMALEKRIPKKLFDRPKQGFVPPLERWIHGPLEPVVKDALTKLKRGELWPLCLKDKEWASCAAKLNDKYYQFLWRVVCFSGWVKHYR